MAGPVYQQRGRYSHRRNRAMERERVGWGVLYVIADEADRGGLKGGRERRQGRCLAPAWRAPRAPEVEHNDASPLRREAELRPGQRGAANLRRRRTGARRIVGAAVAALDEALLITRWRVRRDRAARARRHAEHRGAREQPADGQRHPGGTARGSWQAGHKEISYRQ